MIEQKSIPVPLALKELIKVNNQLLQRYQDELTAKIYSANEEMMQLLGLNPEDGWKVDVETMTYVKHTEPEINDTSIS